VQSCGSIAERCLLVARGFQPLDPKPHPCAVAERRLRRWNGWDRGQLAPVKRAPRRSQARWCSRGWKPLATGIHRSAMAGQDRMHGPMPSAYCPGLTQNSEYALIASRTKAEAFEARRAGPNLAGGVSHRKRIHPDSPRRGGGPCGPLAMTLRHFCRPAGANTRRMNFRWLTPPA